MQEVTTKDAARPGSAISGFWNAKQRSRTSGLVGFSVNAFDHGQEIFFDVPERFSGTWTQESHACVQAGGGPVLPIPSYRALRWPPVLLCFLRELRKGPHIS